MMDYKVFVIETFYSSGMSCVAAENKEFSVHVLPSKDTIYQNDKQCEEAGSVWDTNVTRGRKHSTAVCTGDVVSATQEAITRSPRKLYNV